jgi:hypothetical protein
MNLRLWQLSSQLRASGTLDALTRLAAGDDRLARL